MTSARLVIRIRPLPNRPPLPLPAYQTQGSSGLDLPAAHDAVIEPGSFVAIGTGLAVELPPGFEGQVRPRSGLAARHGVTVLNAPGTIDNDYRGEIRVLLVNHGREAHAVHTGDRIAQLVLCPIARGDVELATSLDGTGRGDGGFGHTGR